MKRKIIIYSVIILLFVAFIGVGTVSIITSQQYKNNNVNFDLEDETAYCEINGKVFVGQTAINENTPYKQYSDSYAENDHYGIGTSALDNWSVGPINFVDGEDDPSKEVDIIRFEITIKNINDTTDANNVALTVTLSDVAVHEITQGTQTQNYFYTKIAYQIDNGEENIKFNNNPSAAVKDAYVQGNNTVNIAQQQQIAEGSTLKITIEYKRNTRTKDINAVNNIKINIGAANVGQ